MYWMLILPLVVETVMATACFTRLNSTQPYPVIQSERVESQRGCEVLCVANSKCTSFAFTPLGLQSQCALLGAPSTKNSVCQEPKEIFVKKEQGCLPRTSVSAEFGQDPCIDEIFPAAFNGKPICSGDASKQFIVRAVAENGRRITLDNDWVNSLVPEGGMWTFSFNNGGYKQRIPVVAAVCATAGWRCGCAPLPLLPVAGGVAALTETTGVCANPNHRLFLTLSKCTGAECTTPAKFESSSAKCATISCHAGAWMFWHCNNYMGWRVTAVACAP